jgi:hypothetical protein
LTHLSIPVFRTISDFLSIVGLYSIIFTYVVLSIPFVFSGICVCLALTRFPRQVSKLYAIDLGGAAIGCILLLQVLRITDGPTAMIVIASLASMGSVFFAIDSNNRKLVRSALISTIILLSFSAINTILVYKQSPLLRLIWVKGQAEKPFLYEKWNSFSRIKVWGDPEELREPLGWGLSDTYPSDKKFKRLDMDIDAYAYTPLTAFDGNVNKLDYLS